ncbi:N-acetylmuramoyl-L-alanine amidase [Actinomyces urogenitalis DSM 15434]|uniref:N-acetylmuramoyl-L-alanine amidase n=1 Tax=Actinomyces urogenitalis DSM 15434 TaxID=525246 RepID=C0W8D5_9ACTO|nr:N-acetylmuramoyl-L-alanine amidase [Actinomyces urogenitalis]EEH64998.1 N-acetylmuramoyl-L-alanine amidase [Actinomyces urogenitalis DSM 15434]MDK8834339.1 N-acetylmuramoyl-L-alanine amidase [Actinomyces urogenitalis]
MPASRYLRVASAISLVLAGAGQVAAVQAQPAAGEAAPAPVQLIELTTASGETTELAQAGLSEEEPGSGAGAEVPAGTVEGNGVAPARASLLAAATDAPDLERDADLLTEPLEVDGFLVAGFTWSGSEALPTGTQIYLRVRESGVWSSWYLNEAADAGPDDAEGNGGTDEFVTGGADAIQAAVVSGGRALPTDLTLALVPAKPAGEEVLSDDDVTTTQADPTEIAQDTAVTQEQLVDRLVDATAPVGSEDGTTADEGTDVSETTGATASAATSAGHGVNLDLPTALAATTTANGLPVPVVTRAEWGANQAYMTWSPKYANAAHVVVHHTAGTNNYTAAQSASIVAGIYYYHAVTLDWGDIGYNFLVDKYGQVFEGRYGTLSSAAGKMVIGGHARGVNTGTMGISMMGNYVSTSPTDVQIDRVGKMAGWFLKRSGVTNASASASFTILTTEKYKAGQVVNLPRILAHRDVGYTTCPGDGGYSKMGQIRSVAQSQISSGSTGGGSSTPAAPTWRLVDKTWYLYGADGARLTGWQKVNGSWYYLSPVNGAMATGWQAISGKWYYLTGSGAMTTGWVEVSGSWYYMSDSGAMVTGWLHLGSTWYYLHPSGAAALGWQLINGTWYYFRPGNAMVVGWAHVNGRWYYLGSSGEMMTGWLSVNGTWYYLDRSGVMLTGWQKIGGSWYYLNASGAMSTGWINLSGTWYYLRGSGAMVTGTQLIDGRYSEFAPSGAWKGYISEAEAKGLHLVMAAPTSTRSVTVAKMVAAYQRSGETYPASVLGRGGASTISAFAGLAYDEAAAEGVSPELLFVQAMKETGWLQYGGDVKATQFNFGGLGATGGGNPGNSFASVQIGLRAQVQHLRAYADPTVTTARLAHDVVDPRFSYVKKGSAPYIEYLGTQENPSGAGWATAKGYGTDLMAMVRSHFG